MDLKWLEDFICLATTRSFSRAADIRGVSQPAFSRRIKQLEHWLGVPLVNRATYPPQLTREGRAFLLTAQETAHAFYAAREELRPVGGQRDRSLNLLALQTLTVTFFPGWLRKIEAEVGDFRSRLVPDRGGIGENIGMLVDGMVDFLLTYAHPWVPLLLEEGEFPHCVLGHERLVPVAAPDPAGPLLDRAVREGTEIPFLSYGDLSFFDMALSRLFADAPRLRRRVVHENTISIGLKSMALAGWGVAWLPESLVCEELAAGRLAAASEDPSWTLTTEIRIYRHAHSTRSFVEKVWQAIRGMEAAGAPA